MSEIASPSCQPRRFSIGLPSPAWFFGVTSTFIVIAAALRIGIPTYRQRKAVQAIESVRGGVYYSAQCDAYGIRIRGRQLRGPAWLRQYVGNDVFDEPVSLHVSNAAPSIRGEELTSNIARLPRLKLVSIGGVRLNTRDLEHLSQLKELRSLYLSATVLDEANLEPLSQLPIEWLALPRTRVSDHGLKTLGEMHALRYLDLTRTRVSDTGLALLEGLSNLRHLNLSRTKVTLDGAKQLKTKLPDCEIVWEPLHPDHPSQQISIRLR
jgi:hypothetical protein